MMMIPTWLHSAILPRSITLQKCRSTATCKMEFVFFCLFCLVHQPRAGPSENTVNKIQIEMEFRIVFVCAFENRNEYYLWFNCLRMKRRHGICIRGDWTSFFFFACNLHLNVLRYLRFLLFFFVLFVSPLFCCSNRFARLQWIRWL